MKKYGVLILVVSATAGFASCSAFSNRAEEVMENDNPIEETVFVKKDNNAERGENLWYMVGRRFNNNISISELQEAELISDLISDYPNNNWTTGYGQVAIKATVSGKDIESVGPNEVLTDEQKELLRSLRENDGIHVVIDYKTQNIATKAYEDRQMNYSMGVLPEVQAEFPEGVENLNAMLKSKSSDALISYMSDKVDRDMEEPRSWPMGASVVFNIDEAGDAIDIKIDGTSGDENVDAELLKLVDEMPLWTPAQNGKGENVKQLFEFIVGPDGC